MDKRTVFLTEKDIDKNLLIKTLEEYSSTIKKDEDEIILKIFFLILTKEISHYCRLKKFIF